MTAMGRKRTFTSPGSHALFNRPMSVGISSRLPALNNAEAALFSLDALLHFPAESRVD